MRTKSANTLNRSR